MKFRIVIEPERGYGDYAELRHRHLGALSVDELLERMRRDRGRDEPAP